MESPFRKYMMLDYFNRPFIVVEEACSITLEQFERLANRVRYKQWRGAEISCGYFDDFDFPRPMYYRRKVMNQIYAEIPMTTWGKKKS